MEKYNISAKPANSMFISAVHRYLVWASLSAVVLAVVLSFVMMCKVLAPLTRMTVISREIAAGNFAVRVPTATADEVGQLARAFNRMAESLEKVQTLRRNLMIDVAHELRTPLTNIREYLEALNDGVLPPSPEIFSMLLGETLRLVQLTEDVLQLARAEAARGDLQRESVDLRAEIHTALEPFARLFSQKSIRVDIHAPEGSVTAPADRRRIARVLRNLTDNAARYTPQHGALDIRIEAGPESVRVGFTNNGGSWPPGTCRIFSSAFTAVRNPGRDSWAAPESAWPSSRNWLRPTAAGWVPS